MLSIIDGDLIAYMASASVQTNENVWTGEKLETPTYDQGALERAIVAAVDTWTDWSGGTSRMVCLTGARNFRKDICATYKAHRDPAAKPVGLGAAKAFMTERYGARCVDGLEADDLIGLVLTSPLGRDGKAVAVTLDKDLATVPGMHFRPGRDQFPHEIGELEAYRWWFTQTLIGDTADGYKGCPGIGKVKAKKLLEPCVTPSEMWRVVAKTFEARSTYAQAVLQARLARILRGDDYDKEARRVRLWHPIDPAWHQI